MIVMEKEKRKKKNVVPFLNVMMIAFFPKIYIKVLFSPKKQV